MLVLFPQWKFYFWSCATLSIYFYQNWIKSVHLCLNLEGKRCYHNFNAHKFHLSYVRVFAKLCDEQIILLTGMQYIKKLPSHGKFLIIMKYTKSPTQNVVVVSRKSNYHCSPRNRDIMQRWSSFLCELRKFHWCMNICFQNRLDMSKQILEYYHYSLIDVRVSRNNWVDIIFFFFLTGWALFLSLKRPLVFHNCCW